ncbi:metallophosphoesterase [Desulfonema ishimotonii]|uniref:Metallophosphoesterase n=1 Tax=Desulfonema ishimotonii TaxID=45657 RepID=A0A401FVT1_9BACT|nr:metallophosphoesterase [Desulfonema ishimotonii]GBC61070.1 metallophosphoesterase [Desulfonema ishimotonii]
MKILTISDRVEPVLYNEFNAEMFTGIDFVLSCGDLPPEYLSFITSRLNAPLYYVRGNHDIRYDTKPPEGCIDLDGRLIRHGSLRLLGLEGSRWYNGNPNQYTEPQMRQKLWKLRPRLWWWKGADIIITHAPPRHIHDGEDLCHRGFRCFHGLIDRYAPQYFIHGHIHKTFTHPSQRMTHISTTTVLNTFGYHIITDAHEDSQ